MCQSRLGQEDRIGQRPAGRWRPVVRDDPQEPLFPLYLLFEEAGGILRVILYAIMLEPGEDPHLRPKTFGQARTFVPAVDVHALQANGAAGGQWRGGHRCGALIRAFWNGSRRDRSPGKVTIHFLMGAPGVLCL